MRPAFLALALITCVLDPSAASAAEAASEDQRIDALERRIDELERESEESGSRLADWTDHVALSGSLNTGFYDAENAHPWNGDGFEVWDARFFVDAEVGGPIQLFGHTIARNAGMTFEWNLVRVGAVDPTGIGDLYIEVQRLAGSGWLSAQLGRFQLPVGEGYLRYGKGYAHKPFISNAVSSTWYWDEGLKLYGGDDTGFFSYVASITENETLFNTSLDDQLQYTLKLAVDPLSWLHLSVSGLYGGAVQIVPGSFMSGEGLWFGEMWLRQFGSYTGTPSYVDGVVTAPGPMRLGTSWLVGADAIVTLPVGVDLWFSYSHYVSDQGSPTYDRTFENWIAEIVLHGRLVDPALDVFYLGVRANGLGTYDDARGYLLDTRSSQLGYNMSSLTDYSVVLGWKLIHGLTLRAEYTRRVIDLVDGTPAATHAMVDDMNAWAVELGVWF